MCGGGKDKASKAAERAERERQATISRNVASINRAYGGREAQYSDYLSAVQRQLGDEVTRQRADASRQSRFATARGGLTGGSAAIDAGRQLAREGAQASIEAERQAQGAVGRLRSADEDARLNLISLAQSGNDIGNAQDRAAAANRANLQAARGENLVQGLGSMFAASTRASQAAQEAAALRRGLRSSEIYSGPFQRGSGAR
jgi:hypothetical protein